MRILLACLLLAAPLSAQSLTMGYIGPEAQIACDGIPRDNHWGNHTGQTIRLTKLRVWQGADYGFRGDLQVIVYLSHSNSQSEVIWMDSPDRYGEPSGSEPALETDFSPHYIEIHPGEWLTLRATCARLPASTPGAQGYSALHFYFYRVPNAVLSVQDERGE